MLNLAFRQQYARPIKLKTLETSQNQQANIHQNTIATEYLNFKVLHYELLPF